MNYFTSKPTFRPQIYAYSDPRYPGCLKVGYTAVDVDKRVAEQYPTMAPQGKKPYRIELREPAMYKDGGSFTDRQVHVALMRMGVKREGKSEWFRCGVKEVLRAIVAVRNRLDIKAERTQDFSMRPEQVAAVEKTLAYFRAEQAEGRRTPRFLWNAKMRFGKTFAAYQLARQMNARRVLVLTFKPAVQTAWQEDLESHVDFEGWQFICRSKEADALPIDVQYRRADKGRPLVCFGSFQDFLGVSKMTGGIKPQHEWVREINWDLVIFDEYHFGAWKEDARSLFQMDDEDEAYDVESKYTGNACNENDLPITADRYLYLSGTPFRALNSGEFIEDQIYNWTYSDEQREKANWQGENNPYAALPRMVLLTYRLPDDIREIALEGEFNEFNLNVFFEAEGKGKNARFKYEEYVQKWLDLIRGDHRPSTVDELKLGKGKPPMPFSDTRLMGLLNHTLWFLPNVAACHAMSNLLAQSRNRFYHDYEVIVCAGKEAGQGAEALPPVQNAMGDNPLESKTITLSCGRLPTGVTVKPWSGIFMLRNLSSPETYFQAAFRVQSPWEVTVDDDRKEIVKHDCYVFDFALDRALKQIADYSCRLDTRTGNPETKVKDFINFLPVLAYDGSSMKQVEATEILDMAMSGTSATLLAKRWESALLVNVDNTTLQRLLNNQDAMAALMRIEGFRSLNSDIETIINKSEAVKKARKEKEELSGKEKKELTEEEKEYKSLRKQIQEKLIKFATRIPIFMYLSDFREYRLTDVLTL